MNRLLRGISTDDVETVRDAWQAALSAPGEVVVEIEAHLESNAWQQPPRGPGGVYLGMLLALLSEVDQGSFSRQINRLQGENLHVYHRRTVEMMAGRLRERPQAVIGCGVPVYVSDDLLEQVGEVTREIEQWGRTPGLELSGVTRVDVIAHVPGMDYLGRYNLFFAGIVLVWDGIDFGPRWLRRLGREHTFYHEVGHNACGHSEGGQVIEQEREADAYAGRMMQAAHPVLIRVGRVVFWPLRGWARRARRRRERLSD